MKTARLAAATFFLLLATLLLLISLSALHPRIDVARMLLAANGSILRGFIGAAVVGMLAAWLAGRLWGSARPRRSYASRVVGVMLAVVAAANIALWLAGMDRRRIEFVSDGIRLEGTLMTPAGVENPPVVVIVHGSAPLARDFYAVWGRHLVREGIAVFVYDKRGTGASEGVIPQSNNTTDYLRQLGRDAAAAIAAVEREPGLDRRRISVLGLSQGGWTVPVAASVHGGVFRMALLSGPVATPREEGAFSEIAGDGGSGADDREAIQAGDAAAAAAPPGGFSPLPILESLQTPGRWYFGDHDRSIPVTLSRQRLAALQAIGKDMRAVLLPNTDHLLLDVASVPLGFTPTLMPQLAAWLRGEG